MKLSQKIKIYFVSFFLTPLGLYWFFKYLKSEVPDERKQGYLALAITVASLAVSFLIVNQYLRAYSGYLDLYRRNFEVYDQLGY